MNSCYIKQFENLLLLEKYSPLKNDPVFNPYKCFIYLSDTGTALQFNIPREGSSEFDIFVKAQNLFLITINQTLLIVKHEPKDDNTYKMKLLLELYDDCFLILKNSPSCVISQYEFMCVSICEKIKIFESNAKKIFDNSYNFDLDPDAITPRDPRELKDKVRISGGTLFQKIENKSKVYYTRIYLKENKKLEVFSFNYYTLNNWTIHL